MPGEMLTGPIGIWKAYEPLMFVSSKSELTGTPETNVLPKLPCSTPELCSSNTKPDTASTGTPVSIAMRPAGMPWSSPSPNADSTSWETVAVVEPPT
jgi:hypothetical protein